MIIEKERCLDLGRSPALTLTLEVQMLVGANVDLEGEVGGG